MRSTKGKREDVSHNQSIKDAESTPLEKNIQRKLTLYSLAASAAGVSLIALAHPAEGEVVFTSTHQIVDRRQDLAIDINHDGITDITIDNLYQKQSGPAGLYAQAVLEAVPATGGAVVADPAAYGAADLSKGASIGPADFFSARRAVMAFKTVQGYFGTYSFGAWFNVSDKYLGFRFKIDGQTHYGWARMTVRWNQRYHIVAALNGYAYETQPDMPIIAGDTGGPLNATVDSRQAHTQDSQIQQPASLAALSSGAPGLALWRREEDNGIEL